MFTMEQFWSLVRTLLQTAGAALVTRGNMDDGSMGLFSLRSLNEMVAYQRTAVGTIADSRRRPVMPRYFFDWTEEHDATVDGEGLEFATSKDAAAEAMLALAQVAKDRAGSKSRPLKYVLSVTVNDSSGRPVWSSRLTIETKRF